MTPAEKLLRLEIELHRRLGAVPSGIADVEGLRHELRSANRLRAASQGDPGNH